MDPFAREIVTSRIQDFVKGISFVVVFKSGREPGGGWDKKVFFGGRIKKPRIIYFSFCFFEKTKQNKTQQQQKNGTFMERNPNCFCVKIYFMKFCASIFFSSKKSSEALRWSQYCSVIQVCSYLLAEDFVTVKENCLYRPHGKSKAQPLRSGIPNLCDLYMKEILMLIWAQGNCVCVRFTFNF